MRKLLIPAFQAAPDESILWALEAHHPPGVSPQEVLNPLLPGRHVVRPHVEYYYRQLKALPRRLRRALQRRYARSLAGVALLLALGQAPTLAATITVGGGCALVDAITAANTDAATGGCLAGSGPDTIALTGNVTLSAVNNTANGPNGLPSITSPISLNGGSHTLQRSTVTGTPDFRLLHVADTGNLMLNQITLSNGRSFYINNYNNNVGRGGAVYNRGTLALNDSTVSGNGAVNGGGLSSGAFSRYSTITLTDSTVSGNTANYNGGGLASYGTLTLTDSTVSGNTANRGGGLENHGALTLTDSAVSGNTANRGGGLANHGALTLTDSAVSGNTAVVLGGGLLNINSGFATLVNSTVSGNLAGTVGGGVLNGYNRTSDYGDRPTLTLTSSTVSGNSATFGGGLYNGTDFGDGICYGGISTLVNSTVSGNLASAKGGGIFIYLGSSPYDVDNDQCGRVTLTNSTISGNTADVGGGGLYSYTNINSSRGFVAVARTLVSGNTAPTGFDVYSRTGYLGGTLRADNFNLFGTNGNAGIVGFTPGPTDIVPNVPLVDILGPLAENGGPTQTHALVFASPAIDASPLDHSCPLTDQRGAFRPQGQSCDIGAFEVGVEPDPLVSPTPTTGCTVNGMPDQLCRGTAGPDRILGTTGNDVIVGLTGNDHLNGSRGEDRLFGGEDNDRIIGSKGDDQLLGQTGDDDLRGFAGDDVLDGGDGNDRLKGHEGNDQLRGGNGDDALRGLEGEDTLEGGAGSDLLRGGADSDDLNGGPGADRLVGGGGIDRCTSDAEDNIVVLCE